MTDKIMAYKKDTLDNNNTSGVEKFKNTDYSRVVVFKNEKDREDFTNNMLDLALQINDSSKLPEPLSLAKEVYELTKRGISLSAPLGHVWLVPYSNSYSFIVSVKGLIAECNAHLKTVNGGYHITDYGYFMIPKEATKLNPLVARLELVVNEALESYLGENGRYGYDGSGKLKDTGYLYCYVELRNGAGDSRVINDVFYTRDLKVHGMKYTSSVYTSTTSQWQTRPLEMMGKTALKKLINKSLVPIIRQLVNDKFAEIYDDEYPVEQGVEVKHEGKSILDGLSDKDDSRG